MMQPVKIIWRNCKQYQIALFIRSMNCWLGIVVDMDEYVESLEYIL